MEATERKIIIEETKQVIASTRAERMKQREDAKGTGKTFILTKKVAIKPKSE